MKLDVYLSMRGLTIKEFCDEHGINISHMSRARSGYLKSKAFLSKVIEGTEGEVVCFAEITASNGRRWVFDASSEMLEAMSPFETGAKMAALAAQEMRGSQKIVVTLELEDIRTRQLTSQGQA